MLITDGEIQKEAVDVLTGEKTPYGRLTLPLLSLMFKLYGRETMNSFRLSLRCREVLTVDVVTHQIVPVSVVSSESIISAS